jgi:hypothetical protein
LLANAIGLALFALGVAMYLLRDNLGINPTTSLVAGLPSILLAILALITAALVAMPRFIGYSVTLFAIGLGGALLGWQPGTILATGGFAILVCAAAIFVRFLRDHQTEYGDAA